MALCQVEGRPEMYGLGIRLACYISWFAVIVMEVISESLLFPLRYVAFLFSLGITIGLIVQISRGGLQPIDIDIALNLTMGPYVLIIPIYVWRLLTCFNQYLDPLRHSGETQPPIFRLCNFALLVTNTGIGVWFFTTYLTALHLGCDQYAFFLSKMKVDDKSYIAFGAVFFIAIVICSVISLLFKAGWRVWAWTERPKRQIRRVHRAVLTEYRFLGAIIVFVLLVLSIELPIRWNKLHVDEITIAQAIPLALAAGVSVAAFSYHFYYAVASGGNGNGSDETEYIQETSYIRVPYQVGGHYVQVLWPRGEEWPPRPTSDYMQFQNQYYARRQAAARAAARGEPVAEETEEESSSSEETGEVREPPATHSK